MVRPKRKSSPGSVGAGGSTVSYSPGMLAGMGAAEARQEARWARKSGRVSVKVMTPEELAEHRRKVAERRRSH